MANPGKKLLELLLALNSSMAATTARRPWTMARICEEEHRVALECQRCQPWSGVWLLDVFQLRIPPASV
jgi:hypothetical protein